MPINTHTHTLTQRKTWTISHNNKLRRKSIEWFQNFAADCAPQLTETVSIWMWPIDRTVDLLLIIVSILFLVCLRFEIVCRSRRSDPKKVKMPEFPEVCEPKPFTADEECAIEELKRLFGSRPDIEFQRDNYFLTKFLRFCDWNPQKAFEVIVSFYVLKHSNPMFYATKNVSEYMDLLTLNSRMILEKRDKCGRIVFLSKLGECWTCCER